MKTATGEVTEIPLVQRIEYLIELCRDKSVLHLGCSDWPFTEKAIAGKTHLHFYLTEVAREVVGFDYDEAGLETLRRHGATDLYFADLEKLDDVPLTKTFDVIVAGEIIEHLSNPGLFLRGIQRFMNPQTNLAVTTINAFCAMRWMQYGLRGKKGSREPVHPDHVAYYSYSTLGLALRRHGLQVNRFAFYDVGAPHRPFMNWRQRLINDAAVRISTQWADGIIAECSLAAVAESKN